MAWEPDYLVESEIKEYVRIPSGDTIDDVQLAMAVTTASRSVDYFTRRQFGLVDEAETREYDELVYVPARCAWCVDIDDLAAADGLVVVADGVTLTAEDYTLTPLNSVQRGRPFTRIELVSRAWSVLLTSDQWGWSATPVTIKQATGLQTSRILARRDSPFGVAGSPQDGNGGGELRLLARVDPDVAVALRPYRRLAGVR